VSDELRYPIGQLIVPESITKAHLREAVATLAALPGRLRDATSELSAGQLDTPYREGGWTVRQVVHHVADSHMNAVIRVRLALTEDWPTIKAYDEKAWAELPDSKAPADWSLDVIERVHGRWVMLLESLNEAQWKRGFVHPERGPSNLELATLLYQWHSKHHLAHIVNLRTRSNW
jgi:uncharacterized damage-inducible protein DinB